MPVKRMSPVQLSLLEPPPQAMPAGFAYREEMLSPGEEAALLAAFRELPFREFEFHGYFGKRRTVSFGLHYDFADGDVHRSEPIPDFLSVLRVRASAFAGLAPADIEHALVTEYTPGAPIGTATGRSLAISSVFPSRRSAGSVFVENGVAAGSASRSW